MFSINVLIGRGRRERGYVPSSAVPARVTVAPVATLTPVLNL